MMKQDDIHYTCFGVDIHEHEIQQLHEGGMPERRPTSRGHLNASERVEVC